MNGYVTALQGMIESLKPGSSYGPLTFMRTIPESPDPAELEKVRKDFLIQARSQVKDDYDRGFFEAWADYISFLLTITSAEKEIRKASQS